MTSSIYRRHALTAAWFLWTLGSSFSLDAEPLRPPRVPAGELTARRARVLEEIAKEGGERAVLLLRAPAADHFSGDVDYPYRSDNNLFYLTGVEEPGCALLLSAHAMAEQGKAVLFFTPPHPGARIWVGDQLTREEASARSGVQLESVIEVSDLKNRLRNLDLPRRGSSREGRALYFESGAGFDAGRAITEPYGFLIESLGSGAFHVELRDPDGILLRHRQIKSPAEVAQLEKAIDATSKALLKAWRALKPGVHEFELRSVIESTFLREGCPGWSFPPIIGSGPNSCILHYERYDRRTEAGDLIVMDIGAEYGCYAADVTRTVPVSGKFSARQRQIYEIVLGAQEAAIREIRPGVPHWKINAAAFEKVAAGLKSIGLITKDDEAHKYLPHGTSHGLGLDVHDPMPDGTLRAGMVITVEPGIYIADENLGVRIEDDVLVTDDGCRILSDGAPRTVEEIEAWMGGREF